jgi:hypothetical protein
MKKYYVTIFPYFLEKVAKFPEMFFEKLSLYLDSSFNLVAFLKLVFVLFKEVLKKNSTFTDKYFLGC